MVLADGGVLCWDVGGSCFIKLGSLLECSSLADVMDRVSFDDTKLVLYGEANGIFLQRCLCGYRL